MLRLEHVSKNYGAIPVLSDVSLAIPDASVHSLIGASGSGKTTLLRITLGLIQMDRGYVRINGRPLSEFTRKEWAEQIGYVPQDSGLFPHLSVKDNVQLSAVLGGWKKDRLHARTKELAQLVALPLEALDKFPNGLSGGQRQRAAIMRAAFQEPSVLLLDEPMGALDPLIRRSLQQELKEIFARLKITVLLVTHDLAEAVYLSDTLTLLHQGRVVQTDTFENLWRKPASAYVTEFVHANRGLPLSFEEDVP